MILMPCTRFAGHAIFAAAIALAGCISDSRPRYVPHREAASGTVDARPGPAPSETTLAEMDALCNFQTTFAANQARRFGDAVPETIEQEKEDLLAPSRACLEAIDRTIPWRDVDDLPENVRLATASGLYALFYAPLVRSRDDRMLDTDVRYPSRFAALVPAQDDGLSRVDPAQPNSAIRALWYERIVHLSYSPSPPEDDLSETLTVASYDKGTVSIHDKFAPAVREYDGAVFLTLSIQKYALASILFHELMHSLGDGEVGFRHERCLDDGGESVPCDKDFETSVYALQASFEEAVFNGALLLSQPTSFGPLTNTFGMPTLLLRTCITLRDVVLPVKELHADWSCSDMVSALLAKKGAFR